MLSCGAGERWPLAAPGVALPGVSTRRVSRRFRPRPPLPASSSPVQEGIPTRTAQQQAGHHANTQQGRTCRTCTPRSAAARWRQLSKRTCQLIIIITQVQIQVNVVQQAPPLQPRSQLLKPHRLQEMHMWHAELRKEADKTCTGGCATACSRLANKRQPDMQAGRQDSTGGSLEERQDRGTCWLAGVPAPG